MDGLGEAAEGQVPFHRIDLGDAGQEEQVGIGKKTVARADHDAGAAHLGGQLLQEEDEALAAGAGVQPVQFLGETGLEGVDGDRSVVGGFGALEGAVECLKEFFIHE